MCVEMATRSRCEVRKRRASRPLRRTTFVNDESALGLPAVAHGSSVTSAFAAAPFALMQYGAQVAATADILRE